jgi:tRNA threonylcarbamoyladenosine biosynthesis protein TsaE
MKTFSDDETKELAREFIRQSRAGLDGACAVITITGELGVGKTQFTQGIAQELGITEPITSPSYVYMQEYNLEQGKLIHVDLWRVSDQLNFNALQLERTLVANNIVVIEWPKQFVDQKWIRNNAKVGCHFFEVVITEQEGIREIEISESLVIKAT